MSTQQIYHAMNESIHDTLVGLCAGDRTSLWILNHLDIDNDPSRPIHQGPSFLISPQDIDNLRLLNGDNEKFVKILSGLPDKVIHPAIPRPSKGAHDLMRIIGARPALSPQMIEYILQTQMSEMLVVQYTRLGGVFVNNSANTYFGENIYMNATPAQVKDSYKQLKHKIDSALPNNTKLAAIAFKSTDTRSVVDKDDETLIHPAPEFEDHTDHMFWRAIAYNKQMGYFPAQADGWQYLAHSQPYNCLPNLANGMLAQNRAQMWADNHITPQVMEKTKGCR